MNVKKYARGGKPVTPDPKKVQAMKSMAVMAKGARQGMSEGVSDIVSKQLSTTPRYTASIEKTTRMVEPKPRYTASLQKTMRMVEPRTKEQPINLESKGLARLESLSKYKAKKK